MQSKTKILALVVLVALVVVVVVSYGRESGAVTIGVISSTSGKYAQAGESFVRGVELAREEFVSNNPKVEVELLVEDDEFSEKKGLLAYSKLTDVNKVDALINLSSPTIGVIYDMAVENGLPVIQFGVQPIAPVADNIFQISPSADAPLAAYGVKVKELAGGEKAVFVYENIPAVLLFADAFKKGYGDLSTLEEYKLDPTDRDVRTVAARIVSAKPKVVATVITPELGALLVKEILKLMPTPPLFAFDSQMQAGFADYERILGDMSVLDGSLVLVIKSEPNPGFIAAYKAKYGSEPGFGADWGYDAFNTLMRAYDKNIEKWKQNIQKTNFAGTTGLITFDEAGVRQARKEFTIIEDGKLKGL